VKSRRVTRYRAQYPGQTGVFHGTCEAWAKGFPPGAVVTKETVLVVNPQPEPCAFRCAPGATHVRVTPPTVD
jgi:hypothetical protein